MNNLGSISHPNKIIDEKVKHFHDYFKYVNSRNRDFVQHPHENHLTLLEKILFRVENGYNVTSTKKVIGKYFENVLFNNSDSIMRKGELKRIIGELKTYREADIFNDSFKNSLNKVISELNGQEGLNGKIYFKKRMDDLISILGDDSYGLEKYKKKIEYNTHLILVEFLRVGFEPEKLTRFDGVLSRILSNKTDLTDREEDNIYSRFPLPVLIEERRGKKGFNEEVITFLKNKTFKQQLEGLYNIYERERVGRFLFVVNFVDEDENLDLKINDVRFYNREKIEVNTKAWDDYEIKELHVFMEKKVTCLAEITLPFKSEAIGRQEAIMKIREALDLLNYIGKKQKTIRNGAILDTSKSFILYERGANLSYTNEAIRVSKSKVERRIGSLYPEKFTSLTQDVQILIKKSDKSLFRANAAVLWSDRILYLWRYLDSLMSYFDVKIKGEDIVKTLSYILLVPYRRAKEVRLKCLITNAIINSDRKILEVNISNSEKNSLAAEINKGKKSVLEFKQNINYPFLEEKFNDYERIGDNLDYKKIREFYLTLFWEAHEQRNLIVHQNVYCPSTVKKLEDNLFSAVFYLRKSILEKMMENLSLGIKEAITELKDDGKKLLEN